MEGLRAEETRRQKSSILKHFNLSEKTDPKSVPWPIRRRLQALSQYSSYTFVDRMFGGHLVSTIVCEQCHNSSQIYEPFLDISLPLIEEKPQRPNAKKGKNAANMTSKGDDEDAPAGNTKKEREKSKKEKRRLKKEKKRMGKKGAVKVSDDEDGDKNDDTVDNKLLDESQEETKPNQDEDLDEGEEKLRKEMEENEKDRSNSPSNLSEDKSRSQEKGEDSGERESAVLGDEKRDNSRDSGLAMSKLSVSDSQKLAAGRGPSDGNEEDDEDDGYSEDDDGWEWDYGEGGEEEQDEKQKDQKDKDEESDNKSTYLDVESQVPTTEGVKSEKLESLNPLPPERLERGSSEREKSSDPTGDNEESSSTSDDEAGTSVVGDIEDNLDDVIKSEAPQQVLALQDLGGEQQLLRRLLSFNPDPEHLDPHMEALCRKVRKLSVASVQVQSLSESGGGNNNFGPDEGASSKKYSVANGDEDGTSLSSSSVTAESVADQQKLSLRNEWVARSLTSIAPRYHAEAGECSIYSCLTQFTAPELLTGNNKWACDKCTRLQAAKKACALAANELDSSDAAEEDEDETDDNDNDDAGKVKKEKKEKSPPTVYSNASKQLLIFSPPAVLTIHLKRFQQTMYTLRKVNKHVQFPLTLDLAPFCSSTAFSVPSVAAGAKSIRYDLYAVVEHQGRLQGGHYTAFVKVRPARVPLDASDGGSPANDYERFYSQPSAKTEEIHTLLSEIERKCREYAEKMAEAEDAKQNGDYEEGNGNDAEAVKQPTTATPRKWFHVSDSHVSEATEDRVLQSQAYILFYERFE